MKLNEKDKINNGKTYLNLHYLNNLFFIIKLYCYNLFRSLDWKLAIIISSLIIIWKILIRKLTIIIKVI